MPDPVGAKAALRARTLATRAGLTPEARAAASAEVCERLRRLPELGAARAVLAYAALTEEVAIDPLLQHLLDLGTGLFLPWVDGEDLAISRVRDLEADLGPGWRGVREPLAFRRRAARPDRLEAALVPGVAFDRQGHRLGHGGGHFDRLLARLPPGATRIGVAFAAQVVEGLLPVESHDVSVHVLVTEDAVLRSGTV